MSSTRRSFFQNAAALSAAIFGLSDQLKAQNAPPTNERARHAHAEDTSPGPRVITPDVPDLPFEIDGNVKVFRLTSEVVKRKIAPFKTIDAWGYNGSCPGPTIQINQGDRVRVIFENRLPESTTVHWHGLEIPIEQDGVPWISQKPIPPGEKYTYEFTVHQEGTFFYHAHSAMQEMLGQIGLLIAHPEKPYKPRADHDYAIVLQEWAVLPSNSVPNSAGMEFNWLTFNGVSAPAITPMIARLGSRVRLRIVNLGMDHHPIHLHGNQFVQTGTEGGRAPESSWYPMNTVLVGVAQACRGVRREISRVVGWFTAPPLPSHDEQHDGSTSRSSDHNGGADRSAGAEPDDDAGENRWIRARSPSRRSLTYAENVKGFPQDAFMEMGMDSVVAKPETRGLPANWSAEMMGMMTLVRVLPDDQYNEIARLQQQQQQNSSAPQNSPASEEHHEHN